MAQQRLPGVVPKEIEEIEDKAMEVKTLQEERMDVAQREKKARTELLELMQKHKRVNYSIDEEMEVVVEASEKKAFVRRKKGVKKSGTKPLKEGDEEAA